MLLYVFSHFSCISNTHAYMHICTHTFKKTFEGFPGGSVVKNPLANRGYTRSISS